MKQLKPRDKITQKMTRDGAVEINETQQTAERISGKQTATFHSRTPLPPSASWSTLTQPNPERQVKRQRKKAQRKRLRCEQKSSRCAVYRLRNESIRRNLQPVHQKIGKSRPTIWTRQRQLSPKQKKLVEERTFDEATGKAKTRLRFDRTGKPIPGGKAHPNPLSHPAQEAGIFVHNKIHIVEKDNSGVEGARINPRN